MKIFFTTVLAGLFLIPLLPDRGVSELVPIDSAELNCARNGGAWFPDEDQSDQGNVNEAIEDQEKGECCLVSPVGEVDHYSCAYCDKHTGNSCAPDPPGHDDEKGNTGSCNPQQDPVCDD